MKTIILDNIRIPVQKAFYDDLESLVFNEVSKRMGTDSFEYVGLFKKAIDARHKGKITYVVSARISADDSYKTEGLKNCREYKPKKLQNIDPGSIDIKNPPVVVGSGPSGLFCAYILAKNGFAPIVIEQGDDIDERKNKVKKLWTSGELDKSSNVQFGEGGAGTFSDGKLVTRINDPRCDFVIETFLKKGAPAEIRYEAKPHIGTDVLTPIIKNIREEIIALGGKFLFNTKLTGLETEGELKSIRVNDEYDINTNLLVLAIGHSARDTYQMLFNMGVMMEQKPFSAGVRIEHIQDDVNLAQWGRMSRFIKGSAEYAMHARFDGRAAYTFCMCPGGVVVNASSEENLLTVNGMSYNARNGQNANSAWVAEVWPKDLGSAHPLAGVEFQRKIEKAAFIAGGGGYAAPIQRLGDFLGLDTINSKGKIRPTYTGETRYSDLKSVLPSFISNTLQASIGKFNNKLGFFGNPESLLTGCETRTSAPVRIKRTQEHESVSHKGLYPAGEGAGYAGGIMSAAVDGIKVAESIIKLYNYIG